MTAKRLAALDIGSNSIRCIIVESDGAGGYRILDDEKATVRLAEGLSSSGSICEPAFARGLNALSMMKKIIDGYDVAAIEAVATSAVRSASNGAAFISAAAADTGIHARIISGEEEAELAVLSARHHFEMDGGPFVLVDLGGGSLEVVVTFGGHIEEIHSLDLGTVLLTEKFLASDPVKPDEHRRLKKHVAKCLAQAIERKTFPTVIGSGGTMTAIASMATGISRQTYASVHGCDLLRSQVVHLNAMLLRKDLRGRRAVPGLNPDRADIIVAGVTVVDCVMNFFGSNLLRVNEHGLREGLILRGLKSHGLVAVETPPRNWRDSVLRFARSCHFDEGHSLHVAKLSMQVFDVVAPTAGLGARERRMLEAAALLHDTGYLISYASHHKHSYFLIRHADLFGFNVLEREIIAQAARYHRKSMPKKKHAEFARLPAEDREKVRKLGGILRLCDGLDRRRNMHLRKISCSLQPGVLKIGLNDAVDTSVELEGGRVKSDLFQEAFGIQVELE